MFIINYQYLPLAITLSTFHLFNFLQAFTFLKYTNFFAYHFILDQRNITNLRNKGITCLHMNIVDINLLVVLFVFEI